jgi:RNA polymerase sigma-70 factor (ECF subfamily)
MDIKATDRERELERIREFLVLLARLQIDPRSQGKVDLSGVVQQTLLEVHQAYDQFRSWGEAQKAAWLRKVLAHNLSDEVRKLRTAGRYVAREQPLEAALERSSARLEACLAADQSSPACGRYGTSSCSAWRRRWRDYPKTNEPPSSCITCGAAPWLRLPA